MTERPADMPYSLPGQDMEDDGPMKVYLAGPVSKPKDSGREWRQSIRQSWSDEAEWLDPVDRVEWDPDLMKPEELVAMDKALLREADAVLFGMTEYTTIGSWREVEYARETLGIPVVYWYRPKGSNQSVDDIQFDPWMLEAGPAFDSFKECLDWLNMVVVSDG